jgi:hypothetical protein
MTQVRHFLRALGMVSVMVVLTSSASGATLRGLSPAEETEFRIYRKVMTPAQARTYRAKATAAERTAYLRDVGLAQRFEALDPLDREAILTGGQPRRGMSAAALGFLWGEPYYTAGYLPLSTHWYYLGSSFSLAWRGNEYRRGGTRVDVYLIAGRVVGWVDYTRSTSSQ